MFLFSQSRQEVSVGKFIKKQGRQILSMKLERGQAETGQILSSQKQYRTDWVKAGRAKNTKQKRVSNHTK